MNDWIKWDGGECPVDGDVEVQVMVGSSSWCSGTDYPSPTSLASNLRWQHESGWPNIRMYRVVREARKHAHYFKDVSQLKSVDVYRVLQLFGVTDPCLQHAAKKILVAGGRGQKDITKDVQEAIDTLKRWQSMQEEDKS